MSITFVRLGSAQETGEGLRIRAVPIRRPKSTNLIF